MNNEREKYLPEKYPDNIGEVILYFKESPFWRTLFETADVDVNHKSVKYYLHYLHYLQKVVVVEGCSTQCDFCDHYAPPRIHPAPFNNFKEIIDRLRELKERQFIQYAYPPRKQVFHNNGETLQWIHRDRKTGQLHDSHDLLRYARGNRSPLSRIDGQYDDILIKTAGLYVPYVRNAVSKIVDDPELTEVCFRYSFHTRSLMARTNFPKWYDSVVEDVRVLRPLLGQQRLGFGIHCHFDRVGGNPIDGDTLDHLQPQLSLLKDVLISANYDESVICGVLYGDFRDGASSSPLYVSSIRRIDDGSKEIPAYDAYIRERGKFETSDYYPKLQTFISANTGEIFVNLSRYNRTEQNSPFDGLAKLSGRLGVSEYNGSSYFTSLAKQLDPMEDYRESL